MAKSEYEFYQPFELGNLACFRAGGTSITRRARFANELNISALPASFGRAQHLGPFGQEAGQISATAPARVEHLSVEFVALPPWNSNQHSNNNRNYSHTKGQHLRKWHKEKPGTKTTRSRWSVEVLSNTNRIRSTQRNVVQTGVIIQL